MKLDSAIGGAVLAISLVVTGAGAAQDAGRPRDAVAASDVAAADDGAPASRVRWERPPAGTLERGVLGAPTWAVWTIGGLALAGALGALALSIARSRPRGRR